MCILIHRTKGAKVIGDPWIKDFWSRNEDGFGAWWLEKGENGQTKLVVRKSMNIKQTTKIIREIETADREAGLHFRMATHGTICLENNHPFVISQEGKRVLFVLGHNGVLNRWAPKWGTSKAGKLHPSDTANFVSDAVKPLMGAFSVEQLMKEGTAGRRILDVLVDSSNKILLTDHKLGFSRVGSPWTEWNGLYMSNTYAWSYNKKERENPAEQVPFVSSKAAANGNSYVSAFETFKMMPGNERKDYQDYLRWKHNMPDAPMTEIYAKERERIKSGTISEESSNGAKPQAGSGDGSSNTTGKTTGTSAVSIMTTEIGRREPLRPDSPLMDEPEDVDEWRNGYTADGHGGYYQLNQPENNIGRKAESSLEERIIIQLSQMSFSEISEWCVNEPDEAALLIQSFLWEQTEYME